MAELENAIQDIKGARIRRHSYGAVGGFDGTFVLETTNGFRIAIEWQNKIVRDFRIEGYVEGASAGLRSNKDPG